MSRLDWVIECNDARVGTCTIMCEIFQYAYDDHGPSDAFRVWLHSIKPKLGKPRLRVIHEAFDQRVWEDLNVEPMA